MPKLLSFEVITTNTCRTERSNDALAVGDRRTGAIRISLVCRFLVHRIRSGLPLQLPISAVKAHDSALVFDSLRYEHLVAPNHRGGISRLRERRFPANILIGAPDGWEIFFHADASAFGSAPLRPIAGHSRGRTEQADGHNQAEGFHAETPVEVYVCRFKTLLLLATFTAQKFAGWPTANSFLSPMRFAGVSDKRGQICCHGQSSIWAARKMPSMGRRAEPANKDFPGWRTIWSGPTSSCHVPSG